MNPHTPAEHVAVAWGNRVRERREEKGLTQVRLAERMKRDQTTISRFERGEGTWTPEVMLDFAVTLGTTVPKLFPWPSHIEGMELYRRKYGDQPAEVAV